MRLRPAYLLTFAFAAIAAALAFSPPAAAQARGPSYEELAVRVAILARDARYGEALKVAEEFAAVAKQRDGEETVVYASAIAWVGHLYQKQGRLAEADPLMERSLVIFSKVLPAGHPNIATATSNLGFQYQLAGRYEDAEKLYMRALDMREKAEFPNYEHIAESLNNLAQIYKRQWRVAESIPLLLRAVEMRERMHGREDRQVALSLANLASSYEMQAQFAQAEPLMRRSVEILAKRMPAEHPELASARNRLGQNLFKQSRYTEAEVHFRESLRIWRMAQNEVNLELPATLADLASNLVEQGQLAEAEPLYDEALKLTRNALPPTHPSIARLYVGISEVHARRGDATKALDAIRLASEVRQARRRNDDVSRLTYQKHVRIAWMAAAEAGGGASRHLIDEALVMAQRATQTDTAMAVQSMTARFAARDPRLQKMIRQREDLDNETSQLEQQLAVALGLPRDKRGNVDEDLRGRITANASRVAVIDTELKSQFPEYFTLVRPEPIDTTKVRALLAPDEALVVMFTGYDQTFVWAISREDAAWHKVEMSVDQLSDAVTALRESLDVETFKESIRSKPKMFDLALAHHLYTKLLGPVDGIIKDKKHLVTVPYGPLSSLPLQVLITGGPTLALPEMKHLPMYAEAQWLVRRHAISVLPSVGSLEGLRVVAKRQQTPQRPLIGFGNPRFGAQPAADARGKGAKRGAPSVRTAEVNAATTRSFTALWRGGAVNLDALRDLPALPETEAELKTVARHLKASDRDLRLGLAATETQVKQIDLSQYRIVYFATHGLIAGEVKGLAEPALALTPPAKATALDDGLLTASEVAQLRLNADWVVLAACNTASGDTPGAEALSGLARAFFYAGARALLVSHWRVGSEAAAKLTTSTFEIQQSGQQSGKNIGRAEALQRAMLAYMDNQQDGWAAYPAFWAPFSVVGEGGL
jgi:CHAT domain-containing protein